VFNDALSQEKCTALPRSTGSYAFVGYAIRLRVDADYRLWESEPTHICDAQEHCLASLGRRHFVYWATLPADDRWV